MSVRKRKRLLKDGRVRESWIVDVKYRHKDGSVERIRREPRRQTRAAAEALEREVIALMERGSLREREACQAPHRAPTFGLFADDFLRNYAEGHNKASELHTKRVILRLHLLPVFGSKGLDEISLRDVDVYKACKLETLSAKTVNNHLAVLRRILRVAADWDIPVANFRIKPLRVQQAEMRFLSFPEAKALVEAVEERWYVMVVTALNTGLRQGELLALQWKNVDLERGRLLVRENDWKGVLGAPKGGRGREIPLNQTLRQVLSEHRRGPSSLVFSNPDGGRLTYQQCRRPLMRACKKAQVPPVQWHGLRHTFASHLVMQGVPLRVVQELLGHSTQAMTERYAHLTPHVCVDAVSVLDQVFAVGSSKQQGQSDISRGSPGAPHPAGLLTDS